MVRTAAYIVLGLVAGLALAYWQGRGAGPADGLDRADRSVLDRRISELETELALARAERQALSDRVESLQAVPRTDSAGAREAIPEPRETGRQVSERFPDGFPASRAELERAREQRQIERFVAAGFAPDRAYRLLEREDELEMEVLRARYDARRNGASDEEIANMTVSSLMRDELGDADYEKYLAGQGRPTSVNVREVLTNSPARAAGLKAGDEILSYDGRRVFEMNELSRLTQSARPGSTVVLEIERDGQRLQVYVEGGPLGVSGGGLSRRDFEDGR